MVHKVDPVETMNTKQPNTVSIDGVEVPSWYFMWTKMRKFNIRLNCMKAVMAFQWVAIISLLLWQGLK